MTDVYSLLDRQCESLGTDLADHGWSIQTHLFAPSLVATMREEVNQAWESGSLRHAGIGRGTEYARREDIRSDRIRWVDPGIESASIRHYLDWMETLRRGLNRHLQLGVFEIETQMASFPPGGFYGRHLDALRGERNRVVSCVFYLNADWAPAHGGQLRLYLDGEDCPAYRDIYPQAGTFVCFLSERFHHEVMPTRRLRHSLTSWMRLRGDSTDPPR